MKHLYSTQVIVEVYLDGLWLNFCWLNNILYSSQERKEKHKTTFWILKKKTLSFFDDGFNLTNLTVLACYRNQMISIAATWVLRSNVLENRTSALYAINLFLLGTEIRQLLRKQNVQLLTVIQLSECCFALLGGWRVECGGGEGGSAAGPPSPHNTFSAANIDIQTGIHDLTRKPLNSFHV